MFRLHCLIVAALCALTVFVEPLVVRSSQQPTMFSANPQNGQIMFLVAKPEEIPSVIRQVQERQLAATTTTTTTTTTVRPRRKQPQYTASEAAAKLEQISSIILPSMLPLQQRVDEEPVDMIQHLNDFQSANSVALQMPIAAPTMAPTPQNNKPYYLDMMPSPMEGSQAVRVLTSAVPGVTYPTYAKIPDTNFTCARNSAGDKQGFFADPDTRCQVYHRCIQDGTFSSYLCPNRTVFNQVTLTCDWFWNVECEKARAQYDYANANLSVKGAQLLASPPKGYQPAWMSKWVRQTLGI